MTVAALGECMVEVGQVSIGNDDVLPATISYGGDTLNTAIYLSRLGCPVQYLTALGNDALSDWMLNRWRQEGVGCGHVVQVPGATPGLYLIEVDRFGERRFQYWRDQSPARRLLELPEADDVLSAMAGCRAVYMSGITLAIYSEAARERLLVWLGQYRRDGGTVVFDGNYRPGLWGNRDLAQDTYQRMYALTDMALPSVDDEMNLFTDTCADSVLRRLRAWGVSEIALKCGSDGCRIWSGTEDSIVSTASVDPVDTTAAGDSFNAGYLAARLADKSPLESARAGHVLAGAVIQHRGAIIPRQSMPDPAW